MKYLLTLILVLGILIALWSSAGDAAIVAATGRVSMLLERHPEVRVDVTDSILKLKYTWIPVFWLGLAVAMSALGTDQEFSSSLEHPEGGANKVSFIVSFPEINSKLSRSLSLSSRTRCDPASPSSFRS